VLNIPTRQLDNLTGACMAYKKVVAEHDHGLVRWRPLGTEYTTAEGEVRPHGAGDLKESELLELLRPRQRPDVDRTQAANRVKLRDPLDGALPHRRAPRGRDDV
jgi:hypothetical protein